MKKILFFTLLSSLLILTSCLNNNNYNLGFELGSTEENVVKYIQENELEYRYEDKSSIDKFVLRVYDFEYKDIEFGTIRLGFSNDKLCYIQYRIHNTLDFEEVIDDDNISQTMSYLKRKYGEPKENINYKEFENGKYYWGEMKSKFMIVEPCTDTYVKVHIGDSSLDSEVAGLYRDLLF